MRGRARRSLRDGGFTLIEMLVAAALVVIVTSAVAALFSPMRRAFDRGVSGGEVAARARTAISAVVDEARSAGSGVVLGPTDAALGDVIPVVAVVPPSTVSITRASGPQGVLRDRVDAGATSLGLDTSQPCSEQDDTCGIRRRDVVAIFDATKGQTAMVDGVIAASATLQLAAPLLFSFDRGAVVAAIEQNTFALRGDRLVRISAGGAEQPVADRVAAFSATLAGRRLDLQLRVAAVPAGIGNLDLRTSVVVRR